MSAPSAPVVYSLNELREMVELTDRFTANLRVIKENEVNIAYTVANARFLDGLDGEYFAVLDASTTRIAKNLRVITDAGDDFTSLEERTGRIAANLKFIVQNSCDSEDFDTQISRIAENIKLAKEIS